MAKLVLFYILFILVLDASNSKRMMFKKLVKSLKKMPRLDWENYKYEGTYLSKTFRTVFTHIFGVLFYAVIRATE